MTLRSARTPRRRAGTTAAVERARGALLATSLAVALALGATAAAQGAPIAGTFSDGRVTLTLRAIGGGQYTGSITIDGAAYQLSAVGSPQRVDGTFVAGGSSFAFQAEAVGDTVTLVSGASRYALQRRPDTPPQATDPAATVQRAVQVGTRLSYDHGAVSHAGFDAGSDVRSVGGRGVTQFTVLHLDDRTCVLRMTMFLEAAEGGHLSLQPFGGGVIVGRDGTCPDAWSPPERLATYAPPPGSFERVERGPFQLPSGGHTFDALVVSLDLAGTRATRTFDLASGVLLAATDGTGPLPAPAREPTSSSYSMLRDVRTAAYPWDVRAPLPADLQAYTGFDIRSTVSTSFVGGFVPPYVERFDAVVEVAERLPSVLLLRARGGADGAYVALAADGATFVPPAAFAQLRPGQRLDEDPVAGTVLSVERVDTDALVLAVDGPGLAIRRSFDPATGLMRLERLETNDGITHTVIETTVSPLR